MATPELDVDYITVPGQLYAVLSFVGPTGTNQKNDRFGLKIRGCFATTDEAAAHVRRLQQADANMDIFVADMYKWLLIPPDINGIENQEYQEDYLNSLIKGYRENQEAAKNMFNERKEAVMRDGLDQHLTPDERIPQPATATADASTGVDHSMFDSDDLAVARKAGAA